MYDETIKTEITCTVYLPDPSDPVFPNDWEIEFSTNSNDFGVSVADTLNSIITSNMMAEIYSSVNDYLDEEARDRAADYE